MADLLLMKETIQDGLDNVIDFWFGELDGAGTAAPEKTARWWKKDIEFDSLVREEFGWLHTLLSTGFGSLELRDSLETPNQLLGAIIVLDQFSRNMFRDTPAMYATDSQAISYSYELVARGTEPLPPAMRPFIYMPLMHSERLVDQNRCVELFAELAVSAPDALKDVFREQEKYAVLHRDIVAEWSRFPHRNQLLGRQSTPEEVDFLKKPGSSF